MDCGRHEIYEEEQITMSNTLYRKKSLDRISSPEQLDEYLHVTSPSVWILLAAAIILLAGLLFWGSFITLNSYAEGTGKVSAGKMTIAFDDQTVAVYVKPGMVVSAGDTETSITGVGRTEDGAIMASADTELSDGTYPVRVTYKTTQLLKLLFN
jgi:hypothetical protein